MIDNMYDISKEIFNIINTGIVNDYQSFKYVVELHDGYMIEELTVKDKKGVEDTDVATNYNGAKLASLIENLKEDKSSDDWNKFIMSYHNGEVKIRFEKNKKTPIILS